MIHNVTALTFGAGILWFGFSIELVKRTSHLAAPRLHVAWKMPRGDIWLGLVVSSKHLPRYASRDIIIFSERI